MPNCIVKGCPHKTGRKLEYPSVTLHGFPNNIPEIKRWLIETGQDFRDLEVFAQQVLEKKKSDVYRMCSEHFTVDCYIRKGSKIYLKKGAVPSIFEPFVGPPTLRRREDLDQASIPNSAVISTVSLTNGSTYIDKYIREANNDTFAGPSCLKKDGSTQTEEIFPTNLNGAADVKNKAGVTFWKVNFDYLYPCASSTSVTVQQMSKERHAHAFPGLDSKEEAPSPEGTRAPFLESVCTAKRKHEEVDVGDWQASEETSELVQKEEELANERTFIVFESCLDQLFMKLCGGARCLCRSPIVILEKKMGELSLVVNAVCTNGHKFELWSSQPRKGDVMMENLLLSDSIVLSNSTFGKKSLFDEVAVNFSKEEWDCLKAEEKEIYREVMMENYQTLKSLGWISVIPPIVSMIERGEEPYVRSPQQSEKKTPISHSMGWISVIPPLVSMIEREDEPYVRSPQQSEKKTPVGHSMVVSMNKETTPSESNGVSQSDLIREAQNENSQTPKKLNEEEGTLREKGGLPDYVIPTHMEECPDCGKLFLYKSYLTRHRRVHTGEKPYSCSVCRKCFSDSSSLVKHQRTHGIEKVFTCPDCEKCFGLKSDLVKHQIIHKEKNTFICCECGESFLDYAALGRHKTFHAAKFHLCSICGECFSNPSHLLIHRKIHKGEEPYSCSECGECFKNNFDLVKHKQTHPSIKRFPCSECGKCFTQTSGLYAHRRLHLGVKPYSCPECGKCFAKKSNLIKHRRLHTGEKPFSCFQCGKCFSVNSDLIKHQQIHARKKTLLCS